MPHHILEKLFLKSIASGHSCLELTEKIHWQQFPKFAEELAASIEGTVFDKAESVEMRIWFLRFPTCDISLVYDDFPEMVSLESNSVDGDRLLQSLQEKLKGQRFLV